MSSVSSVTKSYCSGHCRTVSVLGRLALLQVLNSTQEESALRSLFVEHSKKSKEDH